MKRAIASRFRCGVLVGLVLLLVASSASARRVQSPGSGSWKQVTHASWYGAGFHGRRMASGAKFDSLRFTAAHRTLELGSKVKVTDVGSGRSVIVEITDRGPYIRGRGIDLSYAAARELGMLTRGVARVEVELLQSLTVDQSLPIVLASFLPGAAWMPRGIIE